jgi:hypothetical protein
MLARLAADAVLVVHLAFIVFAVLGAILAFRWRWMPLVHLPAVAWPVHVEATGGACPLTPLENALRRAAGEAGYAGGFVEHYLVALIYPDGLTREIQWGLALFVAVVNVALYAMLLRRGRTAAPRPR